MNRWKKYWLGVLAGALFATAASAQAPMSKPKKAEAQPVVVESTQAILDSEPQLIVLQFERPLSQNIFRTASSTCPNGGVWGCDYVCKDWDINLRCISWQKINCACR